MWERAEELLYLLLWATDIVTRPTFLNHTDSFETWASRRGYLSDIHLLEKRRFLRTRSRQSQSEPAGLTVDGRLRALGGREPESRWGRQWDGRWRLVAFDFPSSRDSSRKQLRRYLRSHCFGCFQKSVWITPDPVESLLPGLRRFEDNVCRLIALDCATIGGSATSDIVAAGWNFARLNAAYSRCLEILGEAHALPSPGDNSGASNRIRDWLRIEQAAWLSAVSADPLLPGVLLPGDYIGRTVWTERNRQLTRVVATLFEET
jgi:DNA-binding transcriptional regulator PaaX